MGRVVILGGGIAGLAAASALARRGREVVLLEREPVLGAGSTGRNAAMFRLAVAEPVNVRLALRSREIGRRVAPDGTVQACGGLYPCPDDGLRAAILAAAGAAGVREARPDERPAFLARRDVPALFSPDDGVIDVHSLVQGLAREASAAGARLRTGVPIAGLHVVGGAAAGAVLGDGEVVRAETVVDATGAWSPGLATPVPVDLGIRPARRHLFVLETPAAAQVAGIVWDLGEQIYVRPESGGLLASPCDETPMPAGDGEVPTSPEAAALLFEKLSRWAPALAEARVRRVWAGLRPLTADHRFVVGPDPLVPGLFRLGGLGGHGMTAGAAAGEVAAELVCEGRHELATELSPARFLPAR